MNVTIRNGRVIDPSTGEDAVRDVHVSGGVFAAKGAPGAREIDAAGLVVAPGLIDIHVHLREPGQSAKETIETGTRAAAAGGYTTVVAMPNTTPPADSASVIAWMHERCQTKAVVNVFPTGCISQGMAGESLAPIGSLKKAGVVAITDDGRCIQSNELMRRAFDYARMFDLPIMDHCQDYTLAGDGVMNEGHWSMKLGLPGWPAIAEEMIIARNALLSELTGHPVHCQHVTTAGGVRLIREARARGVRISGEATPHHLTLTDERCAGFDTRFKMNPPLRTLTDIEALVEGLRDGTLEILASDHAPHCDFEKEVEFQEAPFGILGLETQLGVYLHELHHQRGFALADLLAKLTVNPARLLKLDRGTLEPGRPGDVTLIDPALEWTVDASQFASKSRNTPYHGWKFKGRAVMTVVAGRVVWELGP
jgi:dihydroorotase